VLPMRWWGPRLRLACRWAAFRRFERELAMLIDSQRPCLTFCGSGDFHHVSLALLGQQTSPCNLLVLDKHPDWMRGVPLLHCGTWLWHAAALPQVAKIYHVGGELDFDNGYRWLAPWRLLHSRKVAVLPAVRRFKGRRWSAVPHVALRARPDELVDLERASECVAPFRDELAARPLYISVDKDVLSASEAVVNWDSGHLMTGELLSVIEAFIDAACGRLAGLDMVGDWSPVQVKGLLRRALHWTEHPFMEIGADDALRRNERHNLRLWAHLQALLQRYRQRVSWQQAA